MPQDAYTKFFRFKAVSPSTLTELAKSGYGDITMAMDGDDIVITSDEEFSSSVFLDDTQKSNAVWIDESTIKFTPVSNWGTIIAEIIEK